MKIFGANRKLFTAFTLVEMLVVVAIIGLLIALSTPYMASAMQANRLSSAGDELAYKISLAQQAALTENRAVELRFYDYEEEVSGVTAYRSYQLYFEATPTLTAKSLENGVNFGSGEVAIRSGTLSPLLNLSNFGTGWPKSAIEEPYSSKNAQYVSIVFYPDGTTNIPVPLAESYITLVNNSELDKTGTPPNYYTIQIDPVTGRAKTYRPNIE